MQTLYIDVYFLINFTVDLLSLHLASMLMKMKVSGSKIIISSFLGAMYAVMLIFIPENKLLFLLGALFYFVIISFFMTQGCRFVRKLKYITAFLMLEMLLGGMVYFAYGTLNRVLSKENFEETTTERSLLLFALITLLAIGVLKFLLSIFRNTFSEKNISIKIVFWGKEYTVDALVDSGNLLKDPMDLSPVMLVKPKFSKRIFSYGVPDVSETDNISEKMKERIRIIPVSSLSSKKVLCGVKPDSVFVEKNGRKEKINLTIAFDKEDGSFAGFDALIPYAALENI